MGAYDGGYSLEQDAVASLDDLVLERFHATVSNIGVDERKQYYVYVYRNQAGSQGRSPRRHHVARLHLIEKGVQLNPRVSDASGRQLIYHPSEFNRRVARVKAGMHRNRMMELLASPSFPPQLRARCLPHLERMTESGLDSAFVEISWMQNELVESALRRLFDPMRKLVRAATEATLAVDDAPTLQLRDEARALLALLEDHFRNHLQFVQLLDPVGFTDDVVHSNRLILRHSVDSKVPHAPALTLDWWKDKLLRFWEGFWNFLGFYHPEVSIPYNPEAQSMHVRLEAASGLQLRHVSVRGTRGRFRRWARPLTAERASRPLGDGVRGHMEVGLVLARRIVRAVERKHPRAGSRVRSLAERTKLRMLVRQWQIRMVSRRLREWIFLREEDKYQRRTRNSTTYYLHLPRPSLVLLGEDLIASKIHQGRAGLKPEIRLRVHMRESAISWFSFVPLGSALLVLLGLLPFGTETEGAFAPVTLSASAIISYVFFSYDKPALRRALAPRLLAALALWYLVLSGVRVDLPI